MFSPRNIILDINIWPIYCLINDVVKISFFLLNLVFVFVFLFVMVINFMKYINQSKNLTATTSGLSS